MLCNSAHSEEHLINNKNLEDGINMVKETGEKVKVMISTLKEQASATDDPDLQVKFAAQLI